MQAKNYATDPGYADWFCHKHKKQFYDLDSWYKHLVKHHKLKDKLKDTDKKVTIFDGHNLWILTENGLKKMEEKETTVEKRPEPPTGNYPCPYCSRKFCTYAAYYWHRKNMHPNYIYRR